MAVKTSLRQFQQDLALRLAGAKSGQASAARLGVQCGDDLWLVDLAEAGEIMPVPDMARVPLTKPWYCGLANARGVLVSVIDFAAFTAARPTARGAENRLVLANARFGVNAALLVSRVLGLRNPREFRAVENAAGATPVPWEGQGWTDPAGARWRELKLASLVTAPAFLQVGR
ncbi:MAG: chemotaxis protein CheW [Burkholderiales bacterium]|nr:chemotaxis protein CheW [Burkholderiales bacterium]